MSTKRYRIGDHPYPRYGRVYQPGDIVEIPANEKPSKTWTLVPDEPAAAAAPAPSAAAKPGKRASDSSPV